MKSMFQNESVVETKTCRHCQTSFPVMDKDLEFYEKVSPVFGWKKYSIPTPTLCPDCRQQRRLSFRNERKLYHRKCDLTGKQIISIYSPDKPYKVYDQKAWWSDDWNPLDYGRDFDFSRNFFEQFGELTWIVPRVAIINKNSENSDFTHISAFNKDCYLLVESSNNRDCYYGYWLQKSTRSIDCAFLDACEWCYCTMDSENCFGLLFSENCKSCSESILLKDCINCRHCIACVWLSNREYMILDKQYTKEQFQELRQSIVQNVGTFEAMRAKYVELLHSKACKYAHILDSSDCTGDYISHADQIRQSYEVHDAQNVSYSCHVWFSSHDCFDVDTVWLNSSFIYESINTAIDSVGNIFCNRCWTVSQSILCNECDNSSHLFGCIGLRNKQYCILNKQYTREEYEALVPQIIGHMQKTGEWGEFFPSTLSPFGYNETVAMEYYPLSRDEVLKGGGDGGAGGLVAEVKYWEEGLIWSNPPTPFLKGGVFNWSDYEKQNGYEGTFYEPLNISEYDHTKVGEERANVNKEAMLKGILKCEVSEKPYRIIAQELEFYIKHHLPIPKRHPDQRHLDRMALRNPRKLFERKCDKCGKDMITTYSPERPERVYCENCYNKEVMW